jgi:hypothetical protein
VDDILLGSRNVNLLLETKLLSSKFEMEDLGEVSDVLGIETYLEKILKKYNVHACEPTHAPIVKGDKFENFQCFGNQYEIGLISFSCRKLDVYSSLHSPRLSFCN